jgi:hypothetical protein
MSSKPSTPKTTTQTRKINRTKEIQELAMASTGKQKFGVIRGTEIFPGQRVHLYTRSNKNNYIGRQLAEVNPSEYLRQKKKLNVKYKIAANAMRRGPIYSNNVVVQPRGRTLRRGPGARGNGVTQSANSAQRNRIRRQREQRQRNYENAMMRGEFRE